jgi:hypothetical protein
MADELDKPGDRPTHKAEDEIEVTPAMIEAGVDVFYDYDMLGPGNEELRDAVRKCFLAMWRERQKYRCNTDAPFPVSI